MEFMELLALLALHAFLALLALLAPLTSVVLLDLLEIRKISLTHWLTTWNQEMLAHLKSKCQIFSETLMQHEWIMDSYISKKHCTNPEWKIEVKVISQDFNLSSLGNKKWKTAKSNFWIVKYQVWRDLRQTREDKVAVHCSSGQDGILRGKQFHNTSSFQE